MTEDALDADDLPVRGRRPGWRRAVTVTVAAGAVALLAVGGSALPVEQPASQRTGRPIMGPITTLCTMRASVLDQPQPTPGPTPPGSTPPAPTPTTPAPTTPAPTTPAPTTPAPTTPAPTTPAPTTPAPTPPGATPTSPAPSSPGPTSATPAPGPEEPADSGSTTLSAVTLRQAPGGEGTYTGRVLSGSGADGDPALLIDRPGYGQQLQDPSGTLVLQADGVMAGASSSALLTLVEEGELAGLLGAPCRPPATSHWFVGLGGSQLYRSELVLSNPDDTQAEVDLRFYGAAGRLVVPGAPGLMIPARGSRIVSLATLVGTDSPLTVWVRATEGRVAAMARDTTSAALRPTGADWHPASVEPAGELVIPGIPAGEGTRELVVANAGSERATVNVSVLGLQGPYTPTGAESISVPAESTTTVSLTSGLDGQVGAVQLTSDQPISAAIRLTSSRSDAAAGQVQSDVAVLPAAAPMGAVGVNAVATTELADSELILSNGSDVDAAVTFEVYNFQGVPVRSGEMYVAARATSMRRLTSSPPSYVVVRVPDGPDVYGAVSLIRSTGPVAGVTSFVLASPDFAGRAPVAVPDARVAR